MLIKALGCQNSGLFGEVLINKSSVSTKKVISFRIIPLAVGDKLCRIVGQDQTAFFLQSDIDPQI